MPENIAISCIKRSEDGQSVIVRLYENQGKRTRATVLFSRSYRIMRTNILEEQKEDLSSSSDSVELAFTPYSLCTLSLEELTP